MTITIPQELEFPLNQRAQEQGVTPADAAVELLRQSLQKPVSLAKTESNRHARQSALEAIINGKYVYTSSATEPLASDRFAAEKQDERALEERRWSA